MTALKTDKKPDIQNFYNFSKDYPWFYSNMYEKLIKATKEFFQKDFEIRFMGVSYDENILFYGDEYFVNKITVSKSADFKMKISSGIIKYLLDNILGAGEEAFQLNRLTDIEAMLIKSFIVYVYKNLEDKFNKAEFSKKQIQQSKNLNFTFFVRNEDIHLGKIIITIPDYIISEHEEIERKETFEIGDFKKTYVDLTLGIGKSKITLNDIKAIEEGDIIILENSNINKMSVIWDKNEVSFAINPNPSLIISVENNGGNEMEEETSTKSQNMWDSILVDIVAEFDNVKLTLGELKQISEGLVIDVGSVYENKVKLRVENQVVATGELVILNDRYGVRIDSVRKTKDAAKAADNQAAEEAVEETAAASPKKSPGKRAAKPQAADAQGSDENFDYSDFEIEDESI